MNKKWISICFLIPIVSFLIFITFGKDNFAFASSTPSITSTYATSVSSTRAILNGTINPNGASSTAWFHFTGHLASATNVQNMGSGTFPVSLNSYVLTGLSPSTSYSFRIEASNQNGSAYGNWVYFTTLPSTGSTGTVNNNWNTNTWSSNGYPYDDSVWGGSGNTNRSISVTTTDAKNITENSATLHGGINPNNYLATGWFEYGTSGALVEFQSTTQVPINPSTTSVPLLADITGLSSDTTYYFRAVGKNYAGIITKGSILSLTTAKKIVPGSPVVAPITPPETKKEVEVKNDVTATFLNKDKLQEGFTKSVTAEKKQIYSSLGGWVIVFIIVFAIAFVFAKVRGKKRHKYGLKKK